MGVEAEIVIPDDKESSVSFVASWSSPKGEPTEGARVTVRCNRPAKSLSVTS